MLHTKPLSGNLVLSDAGNQPEAIDALLAKNLVVARVLASLTQSQLATASHVSRATIAQLETGYSDPRLSTVVELARALGIPPIFLLLGINEVRALVALFDAPDSAPAATSASALKRPTVPAKDLAQMRDYIQSGMLKDRLRAAQVGASVARAWGADSPAAPLAAGIFSAILPGEGTVIGTLLAELLDRSRE